MDWRPGVNIDVIIIEHACSADARAAHAQVTSGYTVVQSRLSRSTLLAVYASIIELARTDSDMHIRWRQTSTVHPSIHIASAAAAAALSASAAVTSLVAADARHSYLSQAAFI